MGVTWEHILHHLSATDEQRTPNKKADLVECERAKTD